MSKKKESEKSQKKEKSAFSFLKIFKDERFRVITGLVILVFAIYLAISFTSYLFTWKSDQSKLTIQTSELISDSDISVDNWTGKTGAIISNAFFYKWFGLPSFILLFLMIIYGFALMKIRFLPLRKTTIYLFFLTAWLSVLLGYLAGPSDFYPGGAYGYFISKWLNSTTGKPGTFFILALSGFIFAILAFHQFYVWVKELFNRSVGEIKQKIENRKITPINEVANENADDVSDEIVAEKEEELIIPAVDDEVWERKPIAEALELTPEVEAIANETVEEEPNETVGMDDGSVPMTVERSEEIATTPVSVVASNNAEDNLGIIDPRRDLPKYEFPTLDLLKDHDSEKNEVQEDELIANKNKIIETLGHYGINIIKIKATIGPTVTLYEIVPAPGVKISKIRNLEDDIALSLAALGIRIIAPIPGKGTIGIEVPNKNPDTVSMKSILSSPKFLESKADLPIAIGKTIQNEAYIFDLTKAPHLLIAGATGQGKSVGLNAILACLLFRKHPCELKLVLIDPKKVEFPPFSGIEKHFLAKLPDEEEAIITNTKKVIATLKSLTVEMDSRYDLLKKAGVRTIKEYNEKYLKHHLNPDNGHKFLPYIVVAIDEFADLIQTAGREVEEPLARIAQLARAIGMHLILTTQRPSTNVITGSIKANFPARIAFRVFSMIDSRTILDHPGANQLIGRGDMLLNMGSDMVRLQCAYIDTEEVERISSFIGSQKGFPTAFYLPEVADESSEGSLAGADMGKKDEMFEDAARLIVQHQQGSTSLIQRKFAIGFNRAGRIMDQLEAAGIVGPPEGSKPRSVLYSDLYALEQYLNGLNS
ncbi:MAG: cell division protein FtsK [Bacteroidetes bacterium HGW-Bacteroidetes-21]|jgi:S-DNA-T family DNA segregation ATPase FtsK/SpoIIIE|nr:MAG: cell division protein FtsK [Bacteroidetes bacterium HGW-Bacteroidetes-21]